MGDLRLSVLDQSPVPQLLELHHHIDAQAEQGGLRPMVWLLGTGTGSSTLASRFGTGFAYGHFLNPSNPANARQALLHYQAQFQPSPQQRQPTSIITVRAVVAESESRAAELANSFVLWRTRRTSAWTCPFRPPSRPASTAGPSPKAAVAKATPKR